MTTDRERILGECVGGGFLWCLHCERAYPMGNFRVSSRGLELCPYPGCDGDTVVDAWRWETVREHREDRYPLQPVAGLVYPLYDDIVGRWLKSRRNPDRCDRAGCDNHVGKGEGWVFRFNSGLEFCRKCAEGSAGILRAGNGPAQCYVIGSPPAASKVS